MSGSKQAGDDYNERYYCYYLNRKIIFLTTRKLQLRLLTTFCFRYCNDLEDAFSLSNLVNVVFSSVNICCVVFVIVVSTYLF